MPGFRRSITCKCFYRLSVILFVRMSLTIKHYATKTCRGVMVYFHSFLVLALDRGEWSGSIASHLIPVKEPPVTDRQENSWATKSVWSGDREKSACSSQESKSSRLVTIQNKPSHCLTYHCYVRAPLSLSCNLHTSIFLGKQRSLLDTLL